MAAPAPAKGWLPGHSRSRTVESVASRSQTAGKGGSTSSFKDVDAPSSPKGPNAATASHHQRFVLADPVAFSYLEEDQCTTVLERARYLEGYQCYLVEQWACSRTHPTFVIVAYTGDLSDRIKVGVLSVPADEESWSPRLRVYFKTLTQYHARRRESSLGSIMVTNLSSFPSSLTIIPVPEGDVRKHREDFFVNENLKRLGCSGRVGISLAEPSMPAQAKFHQLYKTSEKIDLYKSVIELVKLCQAALMLFGKLEPVYADGLLCDVTEKAVNDWWADIGTELYVVEPHDGILGPTTVAALLGTLMGARNRLNAHGATVPKDVFDVEMTKRAIYSFQKSQRLPRSRRLDWPTIHRLHIVTAKQASAEGWGVPKAVKSTVAELSGKGGEMVMDMVGRDKATLAEIETVDIERFAQLVKGERAKWLWLGKPRKRTTRDLFSEHEDEILFKGASESGITKALSGTAVEANTNGSARASYEAEEPLTRPQTMESEAVDPAKKTRFRRATGRIKGAVGIHGHRSRPSKDGFMSPLEHNRSVETISSAKSDPASPVADSKDEVPENFFDEPAHTGKRRYVKRTLSKVTDHHHHLHIPTPHFTRHLTETPVDSTSNFQQFDVVDQQPELERPFSAGDHAARVVSTQASIADIVEKVTDVDGNLPSDLRPAQNIGILLRSSQSYTCLRAQTQEALDSSRWPRHLSFSAAEETVLRTALPGDPDDSNDENEDYPGDDVSSSPPMNPRRALEHELQAAADARLLRASLASLGATAGVWLQAQLAAVEQLDELAAQDAEQLQTVHRPRKEEHGVLVDEAREMQREERTRLAEAVRDVETLVARLDYELGGLKGKVEDVEDAVAEFEKQVVFTEDRVRSLVSEGRGKERWIDWMGRMVTGKRERRELGIDGKRGDIQRKQ